ncbi:MAG: flavodoxin [Candidatus Edwardsbacteria bacterium]
MKALVVFYSRTGRTKKIAEHIADILKCDMEEIFDTTSRAGLLGYIRAGRDATYKKLTTIRKTEKEPSLYNIVIIGTPVWAFTMSPAVRTYITENKDKFEKVAFFCTEGGVGGEQTLKEMEVLCGKKPLSLLELRTEEIMRGKHIQKIKEFIEKVRCQNES